MTPEPPGPPKLKIERADAACSRRPGLGPDQREARSCRPWARPSREAPSWWRTATRRRSAGARGGHRRPRPRTGPGSPSSSASGPTGPRPRSRRRSPPARWTAARAVAVRAAARRRGGFGMVPSCGRAARAARGAGRTRYAGAVDAPSYADRSVLERALARQVVEGQPARQHRQPQRQQPEQQDGRRGDLLGQARRRSDRPSGSPRPRPHRPGSGPRSPARCRRGRRRRRWRC